MIHCGDLFDVLPTLPADSIEAVVTDPPYEMNFMSKRWDNSGVAFQVETWRQVYRVLKPGAHMLVAGIGRTHHRMMVAVEDAGFEVRDCIYHLFGSGFPKSKNVALSIDKGEGHPNRGHRIATASRYHPDGTFEPNGESLPAYEPKSDAAKQWDGWGTALKPAAEIWTLFRKPLIGSVAQNVLTHGTGALNIDACRIGWASDDDRAATSRANTPGSGRFIAQSPFGISDPNPHRPNASGAYSQPEQGRWPSNVILGCCGQDPHDPGCAVALLDAQSGDCGGGGSGSTNGALGQNQGWNAHANKDRFHPGFQDGGGASRFFYVAKPSREERDYGCWDPGGGGTRVARNSHPT